MTGEIRATTILDPATDVWADIIQGPRLPEISFKQDLPLQAVGVAGGHGQIRFCHGMVGSGAEASFSFTCAVQSCVRVVQSSMWCSVFLSC